MRYKNFILVLVVSLFFGCFPSGVVIMTQTDIRGWISDDGVELEYNSIDTTTLKRLSCVIRVNEYYNQEVFPITITTLDTLGHEFVDRVLVGSVPKEKRGDRYYDIVIPFRENICFKRGLYRFRIGHNNGAVKNIHSVGVEITSM